MTREGVRWYLTARDGGARQAEQAPLAWGASDREVTSLPSIWIDPLRRFQAIEGFGGAFTEAAAVTWQALADPQREALLRAYFDPDPAIGHGYSLCRVHMNSCDFALGNYAHLEEPGDVELKTFTIRRDRQALLPFILAAQRAAGRPIPLLVSPWSPPAWMKTNGQMNEGGHLRPEFRSAWAQCFVRFIQAYEAEGLQVWGVSVQNEPEARQRWDSCLYSAEDERDFVRDHLGPALEQAGLGPVRIVIWDHNRDRMVERAGVVYRDAEAARHVWGTGFHWYGEDAFDHVQQLHDAWPDKQLLFTEGCQEGGPHTGEWELGERYGRSIINDLNHWTVGWIDWNLLLDEQGGPNHVGNLCSAPMLADRHSGTLLPQSSFHYLGHFARHIRPGARRVLCAATRQDLESTAFINPDGGLALVVMNRSEHTIDFALRLAADAPTGPPRSTRALLPGRAIATYRLT